MAEGWAIVFSEANARPQEQRLPGLAMVPRDPPLRKATASRFRDHPFDDAVDEQKDDGADDGHDEAGRLAFLIEADFEADPGAEHSTDDSDQGGDDDAAGVFSGHEEFGDDADDEADKCFPQNVHGWVVLRDGRAGPRAPGPGRGV